MESEFFLLRELQISVTGVLSGVVQFFKEEPSNLLVGGDGEFPARPEKGLTVTQFSMQISP